MTITNCLIALETVFLSYFFVSLPRFNSGNIAGACLSCLLLGVTAYFNEICDIAHDLCSSFLGKTIASIVALILILGIAYALTLTVLMILGGRNHPKEQTTVIILGCRIKGTKPTRMLRRRLDTAFDYMQKTPSTVCVVTGGRGDDEQISEAQAMYEYLSAKGISPDRIIKEDKSTTTFENFKFSTEITDHLGLPRKMTVVTDGFHQYRSKLIAQKLGIKTYAIPALTEPRFVFIYWIRELMALTKFFIKEK